MTKKQRRELRKKQLKQRNIELIKVSHKREAEGEVTLDGDKMSFCIVSKRNSGMRYNWRDDREYEELLDPTGAIVRDNLTFFKNHNYSTDDVIGSVDNVRVENSELLADVKFSNDEDAQKVRAKYQEGTLTGVSIGYEILEYKTEQREGECDLVTVTKYIIKELSAVGLAFDEGANKREADIIRYQNQIERNKNMDKNKRIAELLAMDKRSKDDDVELQRLQSEVWQEQTDELEKQRKANAEHTRKDSIRAMAQEYDVDDALKERALADDKMDEHSFRKAILDERRASTPPVDNSRSDENNEEKQMEVALYRMLGGKPSKEERLGNRFIGMKSMDLARHITGATYAEDDMAIAQRVLTTSMFPLLFTNAVKRYVDDVIAEAKTTYQIWTDTDTVENFGVHQVARLSGSSLLDKKLENGQFVEKKFTETGLTYQLDKYGNRFTLTFELIVNNKINLIASAIKSFIRGAELTKNKSVYDLLNDNTAKMEDDKVIFSTTAHKNLTTATLSATSLEEAYVAMGSQFEDDGKTEANLAPKYLIVGRQEAGNAKRLIGATADTTDSKNSGTVNIFEDDLIVIVDSAIKDKTWYLMADMETVTMVGLEGYDGKPMITRFMEGGNEVVQVRLDVKPFPYKWQTMYKGTGTA